MTPLRRRMIEDMELKNLSTRTVNTYVARVYNLATDFGRSPNEPTPDSGEDENGEASIDLTLRRKLDPILTRRFR